MCARVLENAGCFCVTCLLSSSLTDVDLAAGADVRARGRQDVGSLLEDDGPAHSVVRVVYRVAAGDGHPQPAGQVLHHRPVEPPGGGGPASSSWKLHQGPLLTWLFHSGCVTQLLVCSRRDLEILYGGFGNETGQCSQSSDPSCWSRVAKKTCDVTVLFSSGLHLVIQLCCDWFSVSGL